jgi:nitrite reductase/ring-hydroxylating ferredoxin subunit
VIGNFGVLGDSSREIKSFFGLCNLRGSSVNWGILLNTEPIPAQWYFEGEFFQHEKRTVFATEWQMLARTGTFAQPGDFVVESIGGWPVFAIAGEDGCIRAFRNVCRHRGMQVLEKPRGRCDTLRCRYHGWTYDFSGRMISTPPIVAPADPRSPDNHVFQIASADWRGLLFINIDREAPPLQPIANLPDDFPLDGERFHSEFTTEINCNWKTYIEHCLASRQFMGAGGGEWVWQPPTLMLRLGPSMVNVQQIVPRTFVRTRVVEHLFFSALLDPAQTAAAVEQVKQRSAADKPAVELIQTQRDSGDLALIDESRLAAFHEFVRKAHTRSPVTDLLALEKATE